MWFFNNNVETELWKGRAMEWKGVVSVNQGVGTSEVLPRMDSALCVTRKS